MGKFAIFAEMTGLIVKFTEYDEPVAQSGLAAGLTGGGAAALYAVTVARHLPGKIEKLINQATSPDSALRSHSDNAGFIHKKKGLKLYKASNLCRNLGIIAAGYRMQGEEGFFDLWSTNICVDTVWD